MDGQLTKSELFTRILTGPRIELRPYVPSRDDVALFDLLMTPGVRFPLGIPDKKEYIDNLINLKKVRMADPDLGDWTVFLLSTSSIIGEIGIVSWDKNYQIVEIFCSIHQDFHGRALGREAVSVLLENCFSVPGIIKARFQLLVTNEKSLNLTESLGFHETGRRIVLPDPVRGFAGGTAIILDATADDFKPFELRE